MNGYEVSVTRTYVVIAGSERDAVIEARARARRNETEGLVYSGSEVESEMSQDDAEEILQPDGDAIFLRDGSGLYATSL